MDGGNGKKAMVYNTKREKKEEDEEKEREKEKKKKGSVVCQEDDIRCR